MLPTGIITLWYGAIVSIPAGWVLCDGNNATPDLRNRFVVGAGDTFAVDASGGHTNHNHDFTSDTHFHNIEAGNEIASGDEMNSKTDSRAVTGTTDPENLLPKYHALAWIMKT